MKVYIIFISIYLKFAVAAFPEIFVINTIVILIIFQVLITELMNTSSIFTGKHLSLHLTDPGFSTLMQLLALKNDLINFPNISRCILISSICSFLFTLT